MFNHVIQPSLIFVNYLIISTLVSQSCWQSLRSGARALVHKSADTIPSPHMVQTCKSVKCVDIRKSKNQNIEIEKSERVAHARTLWAYADSITSIMHVAAAVVALYCSTTWIYNTYVNSAGRVNVCVFCCCCWRAHACASLPHLELVAGKVLNDEEGSFTS